MKRIFISIALAVIAFAGYADTKNIPLDYARKGQNGDKRGRAPLRHLPIEVVFDDESGLLEVTCSDAIEGTVSIYDSVGETVDCSDSLNAVFILPVSSHDSYTIYMEGESWTATGYIE